MFVRDLGKKDQPAVLLLHGAPSNADAFEALVGKLGESYRVLLPDLPGYGRSEAPKEPYSLSAVETELCEELARLGVKECAVLGFSMGALRALRLALGGKLQVNRLVLVGGFAELSQPERDGMAQMAQMIRALPSFQGPELRTMFAQRMLSAAHIQSHPQDVPRVQAWLEATTPKVLADELQVSATFEDLTELLPTLRFPVTAIVGELDVAAPVAHSELISRQVRKGVLKVIKGSGHAVMFEKPEEFLGAVVEGLTRK